MTHILIFMVAGVALVLAVELVAHRTKLPAAALLTVCGLIYATLPGTNIVLDPHVILTFILPPLLYSAALNSSLIAIGKNLRPVISLSVGLVLATALLVGFGVHLFLPAISLAAGIALGAAVSPPDPVAALAIGRRAGLPPKLITLIEGEGLLNDATALTTFTVAVAAATSGGFSVGLFGFKFLVAAVGGLAVGIVIALLIRLLRSRISDPLMVNSLSLITPFAAYLLGEEIHVSGVLAVVVAGLIIGHDTPRFSSGASRLQTSAVWRLVDFLLEGFVFILIGQQLPAVVKGLGAYSTSDIVVAVAVTLAVVLLLRPVWLLVTQFLPRRLHTRLGGTSAAESPLNGREVLVMSWSGTRGVITLAAIFSLPLLTSDGTPFPGRDLLLLCSYVVVLVTLIGQGVTFAPIVRATGLKADAAAEALERNEARTAAANAGLSRLAQMTEDEHLPSDSVDSLRTNLEHRLERYQRRADVLESARNGEIPVSPEYEAALAARRSVIDAQREELLRRRDLGHLSDASLRVLERELDLEEFTLPRRH
ncbi:sodium/proton antiporter, CPA1 family [Nakamurella panacisegetis]|uniref:Sodium/proton antiporter, CPA1 family n=1 Tax=Nakamurella panacisegetis TaxID=1090615 RepID=A0A1H0SBS7_9ACTN|nr:Na+/H+ antiporter [Nakamurella panacisegetis]SDP39213.1 sodium/proton antiporter, CPA1 family [Nakamurella panacisegetis]